MLVMNFAINFSSIINALNLWGLINMSDEFKNPNKVSDFGPKRSKWKIILAIIVIIIIILMALGTINNIYSNS